MLEVHSQTVAEVAEALFDAVIAESASGDRAYHPLSALPHNELRRKFEEVALKALEQVQEVDLGEVWLESETDAN